MPRVGRELLVLAAIVVTGVVVLVHNADLPVVRNAQMYGRAARFIIDNHYDPRPVIQENKQNYGKPILFALVAAPLVDLVGVNLGLKVASFGGTALFAFFAWLFVRATCRRLEIGAWGPALALGLLFFNPLAIYQFWSAYPDGLFAGLVLAAFLASDRLARGEARWAWATAAGLGIAIYLAVLAKLYGLILGLACPLMIATGWLAARPSKAALLRLVPPLVVVFGILGALVLGARAGWNPTLVLGSRGSNEHSMGFSELEASLDGPVATPTVLVLAAWVVCLWLAFGPTLLLLGVRRAGPRWPWPWCIFGGIFLAGLLPFGLDIIYNLRYVLPVLPFVAVAIAGGFVATPWRRTALGLLVAQAVIALVSTLYFNSRPVFERLRPFDQRAIQPILDVGRRLDNLRMEHHVLQARQIEVINAETPPGGILYWGSTYGRNANHGIIEEMGIRPDIEVRYGQVLPTRVRGFGAVLVSQDVRYPDPAARWRRKFERELHVTPLGDQVLRLSPYVQIDVVSGSAAEAPRLVATVPADFDTEGASVEFRVDGKGIGVDWGPPFELVYSGDREGRHVASAKLITRDGTSHASRNVPFYVGRQAFEASISHCRDDAEEPPGLPAVLDSSDLEMVEDRSAWGVQMVALRFRDLPLPPAARVRDAYLQFTTYDASTEPTELEIALERTANSAPFARGEVLSLRPRASTTVAWAPEPWPRGGERAGRTRSPQLAGLIQAALDEPGWQAGGALTFFISGRGLRIARSCDGAAETWQEPMLYVELEPTPR